MWWCGWVRGCWFWWRWVWGGLWCILWLLFCCSLVVRWVVGVLLGWCVWCCYRYWFVWLGCCWLVVGRFCWGVGCEWRSLWCVVGICWDVVVCDVVWVVCVVFFERSGRLVLLMFCSFWVVLGSGWYVVLLCLFWFLNVGWVVFWFLCWCECDFCVSLDWFCWLGGVWLVYRWFLDFCVLEL